MDPPTPITPLTSDVEMMSKGRPISIIPIDMRMAKTLSVVPEIPTPSSNENTPISPPLEETIRRRPLSEITDIYSESDSDFEDDLDAVEDSMMEQYMTAGANDEEDILASGLDRRTSYMSDSTFDGGQTPISMVQYPFVEFRRSVEGPVGPHLFRLSAASSEITSPVLQLSPITASSFPLPNRNMITIDTALAAATPMTAITESPQSAYVGPDLEKVWQSENPRSWTPQHVSIWMEDCSIQREIINLFSINDISGNVLMDLQLSDLKELGIQSFGKRHQIWNHIEILKSAYGEGDRKQARHSDSSSKSCEAIPSSPGPVRRRRRKYRQNGYEPITPADSVSIVAIEQYLPKPHKCDKGDACEKTKQQKRMRKRLEEEYGFPISPENTGRIYMVGNHGKVKGTGLLSPRLGRIEEPQSSEAEPSVVGPSVVASSDLLGPGQLPEFVLDLERLRGVEERDPQDNVKTFLALQIAEPPQAIPPPFDPDHGEIITPAIIQRPHTTQPAHSTLSLLPRLQIPLSATGPSQTISQPRQAPIAPAPPTPSEDLAYLGPVDQVYRYGTPASEMDVPLTHPPIEPLSRETSQSVPANMQFRDQVQVTSTARPIDWRRPSFQLPPLAEGQIFQPNASEVLVPVGMTVSPRSSTSSTQLAASSSIGEQTSQAASSSTSLVPSSWRGSTDSLASFSSNGSVDHRYVSTGANVTHSGWMKKRKTKLLRHEWHERHFRLTDQAQLSMHRNDLAASSPLDVLNIDEYVVACSSIAGGNKLAARLKALRLGAQSQSSSKVLDRSVDDIEVKDSGKDTAAHAKDAAFSFQLVPTKKASDDIALGKLKKSAADSKKTHHFAVKTRDERIDWMRELMLAKAMREKKESGYEVEVVRVATKDNVSAAEKKDEVLMI